MTVYYQFNILPKKSTVYHDMAWFTKHQNTERMMSARKQTLFKSHRSAWSWNLQSCIRYVCSIQMCLMCSLIQDQHSTLNTVEAKIWMRSFTGSFCYDWLAKGRRHPKATGHHTASFVAHDGQTEQLGLLLAMTVGSCPLKNFLSVVNIEKEFYDSKSSFSDWKLFRVQCQWADRTISEEIVSYKT